MKKIICLILALSLVMIIGSVSFAATSGTTIPDPAVPGAPVVNAATEGYVMDTIIIPDEQNAGGKTGGTTDGSISNEAVPGGDAALPKTGGVPAEAFYVAGALIIVAALIISRKKVAAKN